jgi:hypothetical protein
MMAGRRLLEAIIVYCKIDVHQSIREIKRKPLTPEEQENEANQPPQDNDERAYAKLNAKALSDELLKNKQLISMTMGDEGGSSGSDSEPSADNLEEEEMAKIVPIKVNKKPKKEEKKKEKIIEPKK